MEETFFLEEHIKIKEHLQDLHLGYRKIVSIFQVRWHF